MGFKKANVEDIIGKTTEKSIAQAYMSWEVVKPDGTPLLNEAGKPAFKSDKDVPFWKNPKYPSAAEDELTELAKTYGEHGALELTLRVKIKPYEQRERPSINSLAKTLGLIQIS